MTIITVDLILEISVFSGDLTFRIRNEYSEGESYFKWKKPIFSTGIPPFIALCFIEFHR